MKEDNRLAGLTKDVGFQIGVRRTRAQLPIGTMIIKDHITQALNLPVSYAG